MREIGDRNAETLDEFLTRTKEKGGAKMASRLYFEIQIYHDFWMDNAVENFYRILNKIQEDVDGLKVELTCEKLSFSFENFKKFKEALILEIQHNYKNMIVIENDKKTGTKKKLKRILSYFKRVRKKEELSN